MNDLAKKTILYDFYGELLTPKQRQVFEDYYFNDLSLGELAEQLAISRPAVYSTLKSGEKALLNYENKLYLAQKHQSNQSEMDTILEQIEQINLAADSKAGQQIQQVRKLLVQHRESL